MRAMNKTTILRKLTLKFKSSLDHIKRNQIVFGITSLQKRICTLDFFLNVPKESNFNVCAIKKIDFLTLKKVPSLLIF